MKYLVFFLFITLQFSCQSQQIPDNAKGFANKNFLNASKTNAKYYRVHKRIDNVMGIGINPNANSGTGQIMPNEYGAAFNVIPSGVENHEITFYNFENQKILVAGALVQGETYELYGLATWFKEDGYKTEAGFFKNNVRGNYYELYDRKGKVIDTGFYVNGEKFTDFIIDERLTGEWLSKYNSEGYFGQKYPMKLFNRFYKNGSLEIWSTADSEQSSLQGIEPDVLRLHYSFNKTAENKGILTTINYFSGQKDEEVIEFIGANKLISTITNHKDPSLIGTTYEFTKVK